MYFTKYPHPSNFTFASKLSAGGELSIGEHKLNLELKSYEGEIHHLRVRGGWSPNGALVSLEPPSESKSKLLSTTKQAGISLKGASGEEILVGAPSDSLGISGEAFLFQFALPPDAHFYGMGEKTYGRVELSGLRSMFWNTDVWSDFHYAQWREHPTDPPYFSTPYVVCRIGGEFVGFLLDNPYPTWISTPGTDDSRVFVEWQRTDARLVLGSQGGEPNLWIICGPSLAEVTRKLQKLVGTTPLPPIWALGYHQSRWGYGGHADLLELDEKFAQNQVPCDALWLDLDYMRGFRIFETSREMFPKGVKTTAKKLGHNGRRIVPIIDPGVKKEAGYRVFDDGLEKDVFCRNQEGESFVGLVWPGETVFPDFTLPYVREWWADYAKGFIDEGFGAAWLDMNDPSSGPVDPTGMLFAHGSQPHEAHHNQYALGMQMATREGFQRAKPNERPFVLSRSGFTGSSRYAAIWSGDNLSNRFYLQCAIPTAIGLSLSGLPFNGPDMGGFGGDVTDDLMVDWAKAGFLFPFCRNHSVKDSRPQEPWAFKPGSNRVIQHYLRLRYRLLPYLYGLFIDQEDSGEPIMRPLFYHFDEPQLDRIDDQFMIGPHILQAPHVKEDPMRDVVLPGEHPWFDAASGHWVKAGLHHRARTAASSPLFIANGAIIPMRPGTPKDNRTDLRKVEFHIFASPDFPGISSIVYRADDAISYDYRDGKRSELSLSVEWCDGDLHLDWKQISEGYGKLEPRFVLHGVTNKVVVNGATVKTKTTRVRLTGSAFTAVELV